MLDIRDKISVYYLDLVSKLYYNNINLCYIVWYTIYIKIGYQVN